MIDSLLKNLRFFNKSGVRTGGSDARIAHVGVVQAGVISLARKTPFFVILAEKAKTPPPKLMVYPLPGGHFSDTFRQDVPAESPVNPLLRWCPLPRGWGGGGVGGGGGGWCGVVCVVVCVV